VGLGFGLVTLTRTLTCAACRAAAQLGEHAPWLGLGLGLGFGLGFGFGFGLGLGLG